MQEDWLDALRNVLIFAYIFALFPSLILAEAGDLAHEVSFTAYRLRQYDFGGAQFGSRSARVSWNAVSIGNDGLRKSIVVNWQDLIGRDLSTEFQAAVGAVLIVLPAKSAILTKADKQAFLEVEQQLSTIRTDQAVYLVPNAPNVQNVLSHVKASQSKETTALAKLWNSVLANNYVLTSQSSAVPTISKASQTNVVVQLSAAEPRAPTLVFLTHFDSATVAPGLAASADSSASGVAALIELYSVLRNFYTPGSHPRYNMQFVFTTGSKYNYQGTRQYLESLSEKDNVRLITCLDSVGKGDKLYMQVSKVPKEDSIAHKFFEKLEKSLSDESGIEMVHKKINLNADSFSWEHELCNVRKRPAVTLTHFKNHADLERNTVLDEEINFETLYINTKALVNSVISFVYKLDESLCSDATKAGVECQLSAAAAVQKERLQHYFDAVVNRPRHAEASADFASFLGRTLEQLGAYPKLQDVKFSDATVYTVTEDLLIAHITKPAVFELLVGAFVAGFLFLFYTLAINAEQILYTLIKL